MSHDITAADLLAFGDVLDRLDEEASPTDGTASSMSIERAAELMGTLAALRKRCADTEALLKSVAIKQLETGKPRLVGTQVFSRKPKLKRQPNHERIRTAVIGHSLYDENGEARTPVGSADAAYRLMMGLFVAESTEPKKGGLAAIELAEEDAVDEKITSFDLKITDVGE